MYRWFFLTLDLVTVKDSHGNTFSCHKNDPRYLSGELLGANANTLIVEDIHGNRFACSKEDPRYLSGELISINKNKIVVKDKNNNFLKVRIDDPRYISGELLQIHTGNKQKLETIEKRGSTFKIIKHQRGKRNSQFGKQWIYNSELRCNKKILKTESVPDGWIRGRKIKI